MLWKTSSNIFKSCDNYQCFDTSYYLRSVFLIHVDRNITPITIDPYYVTANKNKHKLIPRTLKIMNRMGVQALYLAAIFLR